MCAAHPADQPGFSAIPAGMPFAARRELSSVNGSALARTATAPSALKRSPIRTSSHPDKPSGPRAGDPFQLRVRYGSPSRPCARRAGGRPRPGWRRCGRWPGTASCATSPFPVDRSGRSGSSRRSSSGSRAVGFPSTPRCGGLAHQRRHVERVLEAEAPRDVGDAVVAVAEVVDRQPLVLRHVRDALGGQRDDQHALVQHVVVLDVGAQRQRRRLRVGVQEDRGAGRRARPAARARAPRRRTRAAGPPPRSGAR